MHRILRKFKLKLFFCLLLLVALLFIVQLFKSNPIQNSFNFRLHEEIEFRGATIHVVRLDLNDFDLFIERAKNGREKVLSIAKRTGADYAVNSSFFHTNGKISGTLKVLGDIVECEKDKRGSLLWSESKIICDRISCSNNCIEAENIKNIDFYENIVTGLPLLIHNFKPVDTSKENAPFKFLNKKFPRTAIGINGSRVVIAVVEGFSIFGVGLSIDDLTDFLLTQKVEFAVNLDGGGSSTLVIDNQVINSVKFERSVSDALIFRKKAYYSKS